MTTVSWVLATEAAPSDRGKEEHCMGRGGAAHPGCPTAPNSNTLHKVSQKTYETCYILNETKKHHSPRELTSSSVASYSRPGGHIHQLPQHRLSTQYTHTDSHTPRLLLALHGAINNCRTPEVPSVVDNRLLKMIFRILASRKWLYKCIFFMAF